MNKKHSRRNAGKLSEGSSETPSRRHFLKQLAGLGAGGLLLLHGLSACGDSVSGPDSDEPDDPDMPPPAVEKPEVPAGLSTTLSALMQAYIDRVYDNGGRILDIDKLAADLQFLERENLLSSLHSAFIPHAGLDQAESSGPVGRWFNLLDKGDGIQSENTLRPSIEGSALRFNNKLMRFSTDAAELLRLQPGQSFTAIFLADISDGSGYALSVPQRLEMLMNASNNATPRFNLNGSTNSNISRAGSSQGGVYANSLVYDGARPNQADFYFNNVFERTFDEFSGGDAGASDTPLFMGRGSDDEASGPDMKVYGLWLFDRALEPGEIAAFSLFQSSQFPDMGWYPGGLPELEEEELLSYLENLHLAGGYLRPAGS